MGTLLVQMDKYLKSQLNQLTFVLQQFIVFKLFRPLFHRQAKLFSLLNRFTQVPSGADTDNRSQGQTRQSFPW